MTDDKLLTEAELELMNALWDVGSGTVRDVQAALPPGRAYTTVSTILRILVDKGFAVATPEGRAHRYAPAVSRADYQERSVRHLVGHVFEGDALALARHLVSGEVSADQLEALRRLVDARLGR